MRDGFLGNGGERNELSEMRSGVARGSGVLSVVRNASERDRPPPAPGGTRREQGARRRNHGARPRGERTPAGLRQGGTDSASRCRGGGEGDEGHGRGGTPPGPQPPGRGQGGPGPD